MNLSVLTDILPIADSINLIGVRRPFKFIAVSFDDEGGLKKEFLVPRGKFSITVCTSEVGVVLCYYIHMECKKGENPFLSFDDFQDLIAEGIISLNLEEIEDLDDSKFLEECTIPGVANISSPPGDKPFF
jgi:hypothetical protein